MALTHIENGAARLTRKLGLSPHLTMLDYAWEAELGRLSKMVRIAAINRDALVVEADSAPAMQEISLRRNELIRRLNKHFPVEVIKEITVRIAQKSA